MTMDRNTALATLRLSGNPDRQTVVAAYTRLARRYPSNQFPERHERLLRARELLLEPDPGFREILFDSEAALDWYPRPESASSAESDSLPQSLGAILRPLILRGPDLDEQGPIALLQEMMEQLDPELLEKLMGEEGGNPPW